MSEDKVRNFPGRGRLDEAAFQQALRGWRAIAHRRGMVVASPIRLVGGERTFYGDSDDVTFGPKSFRLTNVGGLGWAVDGLSLSKAEKAFVEEVGDVLMDRAEYDIKDQRAPSAEKVEDHQDERGRWEIWAAKNQRIGTVVRVGEGSQKHYLLYLWFGSWVRVTGQPPFDIPMFGASDLPDRGPIMIHEGPKAREGAVRAATSRFSRAGRLGNWMGLYHHVGWHGSDIGMEWTDWSPLRGRRVLIWPDMDEPGLIYARDLADRIARMGNVVEYVNWGKNDIQDHESWDWGDHAESKLDHLTRAEIRKRIQQIESPVDPRGYILPEWAQRTFYDRARKELYQISTGYQPEPVESVAAFYGIKGFQEKIAKARLNPFVGVDFLPGRPFGRLDDGKINVCKDNIREPMTATPLPLSIYRRIRKGWLKPMIPDWRQRNHLLRRAAWALCRPHLVSRHMTILQGESSIGKSVFLDALVRVAGGDRAASVLPETIFSKFNGDLAMKSLVAVHEIHSNDLNRKQNASRLKDLIANDVIEFEQKNRPRIRMKNVIHWFAATNEEVPFALEHGNDRFYFVKCEAPKGPKGRLARRRFFDEWVPKFEDTFFCDRLYAAAKWVCLGIEKADREAEMTGRAPRQERAWGEIAEKNLMPWEQVLRDMLATMVQDHEEDSTVSTDNRPAPAFYGDLVVTAVRSQFKHVGPTQIRDRMNRWGYEALKETGGERVRRMEARRRQGIWCRRKDAAALLDWKEREGGWVGLAVWKPEG